MNVVGYNKPILGIAFEWWSPKMIRFAILCCCIIVNVLFNGPSIAQGAGGCPSYPPVLNVSGKTFYTDTKGSQVNDAAQKENEAKQKPIADFLHYELESLDGTPSWSHIQGLSAPCANTLLESWAKAGALSATRDENGNYSSQGGIDRQVLIRSFIFVGLKLQSKGFELGPNVIPWLRKLVQHNNENWRKISLRSNLYYWAGSIAANFALLSHDQDSLNFQNEVWKYAMSAIRDDGVLDSEATRGTRALVYHQYALSALLTLREARRALGLRAIDVEQRKLRVLADRVGTALCHPETMAGIASEKTQELPGEWGYREVAAFGKDLLSPDWTTCGVAVRNFFDINNGGDQIKNAELFHSMSKAH